jgi:PAS domain S-box-containing protein
MLDSLPAAILFTNALLGAVMFVFMRRHRSIRGMDAFQLMVVAMVIWSVAAAFEALATTEHGKRLWSVLAYIGAAPLPVLFYLFVQRYTHTDIWIRPTAIALLFVVPLISLVSAATTHWHELYWTSIVIDPATGIGLYGHGPMFWLLVLYSYALLGAAIAALIRARNRYKGVYRRQMTSMVLMAALPFLANASYVLDFVPVRGLEPTPITFLISFGLLWFGLIRYRILDLIPVARDVLVDTLGDAVLVFDARHRLVDVNPAAARLLGADSMSLLGQSLDEACRQHPALGDLLMQHADSSDAQVLSITLGEGEAQRELEVRLSPLGEGVIGVSGQVVMLRDITRRARAEAALRAYTEELEVRNQELDAFARTVAHDLKTPLSTIIGAMELATDASTQLPPGDQAAVLKLVADSARNMDDIIHEILLLASVRSDARLEVGPVDMATCVAAMRRRLGDRIATAQAIVTAPDSWPTVVGHGPWIEQVWVNYVSNALKYGGRPDRGTPPLVELGWSMQEQMVRFHVRDNGPGLSPEQTAQLFREFTRLESFRAEGHGLGLSIVRRIVSRLGGEAGVESTPGEGSTFWFTLPAV